MSLRLMMLGCWPYLMVTMMVMKMFMMMVTMMVMMMVMIIIMMMQMMPIPQQDLHLLVTLPLGLHRQLLVAVSLHSWVSGLVRTTSKIFGAFTSAV